MKKKIVTLCLVAALAVTAIGGTLAYFTDKDSDTNTMTLGNVDIEQLEKDQNGADFKDQDLFPMVDNREEGDTADVDTDGFFNDDMANVIDKIITVENKGSEAAYVRTIIAFETAKVYEPGSSTEYKDAHDLYIGVLGDFKYLKDDAGNFVTTTIDGVDYVLAVKVYEDELASGATSDPSLKQFFLAPTANNEVLSLFGETYTILALSQAVQSEGFEEAGAAAALNEAFGEVTAANAKTWFEAE